VALVAGALGLAGAGLVALAGIPGRLAPMKVGIDALDYVDPALPIHRDMVFYRDHVGGLNVARVWVTTAPGAITDPEVLRGLDRFAALVEEEREVSSVVGPTTFLRMRRYLATGDERLPPDPAAFAALTGDVEQLLLSEPELRAFVDAGSLANAQLTVVFRGTEERDFARLQAALRADWGRAAAEVPALGGAAMRVVGEALLQAKVGASLVPTLAESFALTAALIFVAFLFVFRSASARLLAMIPSVFAILVTFLGMRLTGTPLNVATILIATTVLGTTENDQIHFFHHLHEGEGEGGLDGALRHALRVSGRAIVFATLINAAGFLGLSFASFPPLRQFGVVTAAAFLLAMIADFTALPAALWLARRERPRDAPQGTGRDPVTRR
jgi:predicted RND superfamily exporter protein